MNPRVRAALIAAAIVIVDRLTKVAILDSFPPHETIPIISGIFNIIHAENRGAAFNMLADASPLIRKLVLIGFSSVVLVFVGIMLWRKPKSAAATNSLLAQWALALVFGGALGNLIDRIFRGTVTDFIQVFIGSYEFPSFNVADSAITIGAGLLILDLLRNRKTD